MPYHDRVSSKLNPAHIGRLNSLGMYLTFFGRVELQPHILNRFTRKQRIEEEDIGLDDNYSNDDIYDDGGVGEYCFVDHA